MATPIEVLGLEGKKPLTPSGLLAMLREGLPYKALERTIDVVGMAPGEIMQVLSIPKRTLVRRKKEARLHSLPSPTACIGWPA